METFFDRAISNSLPEAQRKLTIFAGSGCFLAVVEDTQTGSKTKDWSSFISVITEHRLTSDDVRRLATGDIGRSYTADILRHW